MFGESEDLDKFIIKGGKPLIGEVEISGAKNAAVAIIPAAILADGPCILENVPNISDVSIIIRILFEMGASVKMIDKTTIEIDDRGIKDPVVPYEMARHMRASYYFLGTLLGKFKRARVAMPGGCDLGDRPIDQHLKGDFGKRSIKALMPSYSTSLALEQDAKYWHL